MSRQMHPGLFSDVNTSQSFGMVPSIEPLSLFESLDTDKNHSEILENFERLKYEVQEWMKTANLKTDRALQRGNQIEEKLRQLTNESHDRFAYLSARTKDKASTEAKVETLLNRHNQIIQNFELRLGQAQRLIENQSMQLARQQEALDEARRQLEKLKRL